MVTVPLTFCSTVTQNALAMLPMLLKDEEQVLLGQLIFVMASQLLDVSAVRDRNGSFDVVF